MKKLMIFFALINFALQALSADLNSIKNAIDSYDIDTFNESLADYGIYNSSHWEFPYENFIKCDGIKDSLNDDKVAKYAQDFLTLKRYAQEKHADIKIELLKPKLLGSKSYLAIGCLGLSAFQFKGFFESAQSFFLNRQISSLGIGTVCLLTGFALMDYGWLLYSRDQHSIKQHFSRLEKQRKNLGYFITQMNVAGRNLKSCVHGINANYSLAVPDKVAELLNEF
ncbi:hypothetical protein HYX58_04780 [Candidatus Dependentiae bacterium]|nr:hypothetical protein [Candidatus Dependentiae bacterium]